jgi:hypothetical protein
MRVKHYFWVGLGLYALLSVADFKLTHTLLTADEGAYESNPVAGVWLERYGWAGLAAFKAASVVVFAGALVVVARRRPRVAAGVVTLGCAVLVSVTAYSHGLIRASRAEAAEATAPTGPVPVLVAYVPTPFPPAGLPGANDRSSSAALRVE